MRGIECVSNLDGNTPQFVGIKQPAAMRCLRVWPSTNSMTRKGCPLASPIS
jgi:hypothetical protein